MEHLGVAGFPPILSAAATAAEDTKKGEVAQRMREEQQLARQELLKKQQQEEERRRRQVMQAPKPQMRNRQMQLLSQVQRFVHTHTLEKATGMSEKEHAKMQILKEKAINADMLRHQRRSALAELRRDREVEVQELMTRKATDKRLLQRALDDVVQQQHVEAAATHQRIRTRHSHQSRQRDERALLRRLFANTT